MEQLHFITKLLDIKDPNIKILDIINMDTHKEIIAKLDYEAPSCPDCGSLMKKYDFQKPSKIPYLETTGMPTRILLRKRRFKCYHCSKMMVKDTHKEIIAKLDYDAPSCPECGNQLKKYDFQKPSKIPYLETTGMPTRILLRKRRFKCYHCSKMMVAETYDDVQSYFFSFYYITVLNLALLDSPLLSIYSEKRRKNLRIISGLVIKFFSQYRKVEKVVVFHEYVR
ncbi:transposase-like protein [Streptococcus pneumoniae]|nr:transposase-like protein [Streptococcus pneumoniae]